MSKKTPSFPHQNQNKLIAQKQTISYSSPFPPPGLLAEFEKLAPGSAREVLDLSRKSVEAQIEIQKKNLDHSIRFEFRKLHIASTITITALIGGFVMVILNHDIKSFVLLIAELATLAGAFLYSKGKKN